MRRDARAAAGPDWAAASPARRWRTGLDATVGTGGTAGHSPPLRHVYHIVFCCFASNSTTRALPRPPVTLCPRLAVPGLVQGVPGMLLPGQLPVLGPQVDSAECSALQPVPGHGAVQRAADRPRRLPARRVPRHRARHRHLAGAVQSAVQCNAVQCSAVPDCRAPSRPSLRTASRRAGRRRRRSRGARR
jgi:hypothetical protein